MSGYQGVRMGSVQTTVVDAPLAGYPGQLFNFLDPNVISGFPVEDVDGVVPGLGVVSVSSLPANGNGGTPHSQPAPFSVGRVTAATVLADFVGIAIREDAMENDATGNPVWPNEQMAPILEKGRIFVTAPVAIAAKDPVHMYVQDTLTHGNPIGSFTNAATADTIDLSTIARWYRAADAGKMGVIELNY